MAQTQLIVEARHGADGSVVSTLQGGSHPHNTICDDRYVFMGGRRTRYLIAKSLTSSARVKAGPSPSAKTGVRPFTVNANDTRAYITWTKYRGFSVANLTTGAIIASENFGAVPSGFSPTSPSHGISRIGDIPFALPPTVSIQSLPATRTCGSAWSGSPPDRMYSVRSFSIARVGSWRRGPPPRVAASWSMAAIAVGVT